MRKSGKVFVTAAITGAVHVKSMSPYLPVTPQQIVDDAVRAYEAGASTAHIHTRNPETGEPDASIELMREVIEGIHRRCDMIVCATTGASQMMSVEERLAPVIALQPELATCNAGSMDFVLADIADKIPDGYGWEKPYLEGTRDHVFANTYKGLETYIRTMNANGTRPEFEVYDPGMINNIAYFIKRGIAKTPVYIQFVTGIQGGIPASPKNLIFLVETANELLGEGNYFWSVAAAGRHQMPMAAVALALGGNVRVGLEDNLYLRPHVLAQSSGEQVAAVRSMADALGMELATSAEVRQMLTLRGLDQPASDPGK
jgi:uncharacterized protein (DUF849 family)